MERTMNGPPIGVKRPRRRRGSLGNAVSCKRPEVDGVLFDLDGVLIDSEGLHYRAYAEVLRRFGVEIAASEYGPHWVRTGRGPEYAVERYGLAVTPDELRRLKAPIYRALLRREVQLMPGARGALERLCGRFRIALATNSSAEDTDFVVARFDLADAFDALVTREQYRDAKPAPDAYATAASRLGCRPERCVAVEDAERGVESATRAGCRAVAVPNAFTAADDFGRADRIVGSLDDVTVALLEEVLLEDREGS
jgi:HAD superfamily hydrolase (TIGR01509 family)